jgi:hypothetical protein
MKNSVPMISIGPRLERGGSDGATTEDFAADDGGPEAGGALCDMAMDASPCVALHAR